MSGQTITVDQEGPRRAGTKRWLGAIPLCRLRPKVPGPSCLQQLVCPVLPAWSFACQECCPYSQNNSQNRVMGWLGTKNAPVGEERLREVLFDAKLLVMNVMVCSPNTQVRNLESEVKAVKVTYTLHCCQRAFAKDPRGWRSRSGHRRSSRWRW